MQTSEIVELARLKPHPDNYRDHPADEIEEIKQSIRSNGVYRNVVVAEDDTILAGHGVVLAARELELAQIPVVRLPIDPYSPAAYRVLAGDNEIARRAITDDRKLTDILRGLAEDDLGLLGTGFDLDQLAALAFVTRPADEIADFDAAREWVGLPAYDVDDPSARALPELVIHFKTDEDRARFVEEHNLRINDMRGGRRWSTSYPFEENDDLASVKFQPDDLDANVA